MRSISVRILFAFLLLAVNLVTQSQAAQLTNATFSYREDRRSSFVDPFNLSPAGCHNAAPFFSIQSSPCNGISVTSVVFNNASRSINSGTDKTVGVVYRYTNVATAPDGTSLDALVTVLSYANNQDANQTNFFDADVPGATNGFDQNLQPDINQESLTYLTNGNWSGNITYRIQFVTTGTATAHVITIAATTIDNDGGGVCGGTLRETVSYSAGFSQILTSATTNQTVAGNSIQGPTSNQAGIGASPDYSASAVFVNVSQLDWTYGFATTGGNCTPGGASVSRLGSLNLNCQINFGRNFASVPLSGTVFNDANGLTDSTVNGTGTGTPGGTALFANLLDVNGNVVSTVGIAANGTYSFPIVVPGTYNVQLSSTQGVESSAAPANTLPVGWVSTGENLGAAAGNDGTINGRLPITVAAAAVTNANFAIEQRPVPNNNTAVSQVNPGGTFSAIVPATTFTATDSAPGTVSNIRISGFPSNATSITINGTPYTSGTFPVGGVVVPANAAGNPTQAILVDPINGAVTVGIPYFARDNAGVESSAAATASAPFSLSPSAAGVSVGGRVLTADGRGAAFARVVLTDQTGRTVYALTNPFGYFRFVDVESGRAYSMSITSKTATYQPRAFTINEDLTEITFSPQQ
ncbi:MAG: carboxypeptidase-like regulatory domain-containing protein [Acidobacteriota bacterium]